MKRSAKQATLTEDEAPKLKIQKISNIKPIYLHGIHRNQPICWFNASLQIFNIITHFLEYQPYISIQLIYY